MLLKKLLLLSMTMILLSSGMAVAAEKEALHFGIISTESSQNLRQAWDPLLQDMEKKTGYTVKAFFAPDYAGIVEGMRFNKVQLAWYGNKSAIEAVDRSSGEVFATVVNLDGTRGYYSHLIVNKDSALNTLEDVLKGTKTLNFGNGDPNSTSGFLVPGYYVFAQNKIDPKTAFKRVLNSNHETNALSVANKQLDVATCNSEALERLNKTNPDKRALIKVVWTSPLIPSDPLVWRKDLPDAAKTAIRDFLLGYGKTPEEQKVLSNLGWSSFATSDNKHLYPIRELELFKKKTSIANDTAMPESERQAKIAEIDAQLVKIQADTK